MIPSHAARPVEELRVTAPAPHETAYQRALGAGWSFSTRPVVGEPNVLELNVIVEATRGDVVLQEVVPEATMRAAAMHGDRALGDVVRRLLAHLAERCLAGAVR